MIANPFRSALGKVGWRYLVRHPWQSALMILGIALGVAVVVAIDLANASAGIAFQLSTETLTGKATHQILGGPQGVDELVYVRLKQSGWQLPAAAVVTYTVVESLCRFVNAILPGSELQHLDEGLPRENFARLYKDSMDEYFNVKKSIKPGNLMEIKYEDFIKQPGEILRDIYKRLDIPGIEEAMPLMESYLGNNHHESRMPYQILPETYRLVNEYAGDIVLKLGYQVIEPPH